MGSAVVWYWIMSPIWMVLGGAFIMKVMSPAFSVGCMLWLPIMVGVKPSNPVLLHTAIKPISAMIVQYDSWLFCFLRVLWMCLVVGGFTVLSRTRKPNVAVATVITDWACHGGLGIIGLNQLKNVGIAM